MPPDGLTLARRGCWAVGRSEIVETILTGEAAFPAERTLTVNGIQEACLRSKGQGGERLETHHLAVTYRPPAASHHARR